MKCISIVVGIGLLGAFGCAGQAGGESVSSDQETLSSQEAVSSTEIPVDFPDKPRTSARVAPAATATMKYFGGPVIPNAKVYVVWWGDPSKLNPVLTAAHVGTSDFFFGITNSKYIDWLNEYNTTITTQAGSHAGSAGTGQRIGRGSFAGALTLSPVPAGNVTDPQIQSTLDAALTAGTLPQPDDNTIYAIFFPRSVTITLPGAGSSCSAFGAYHFNTVETTRHNAYYLVMPDCGNSFASFTRVSSHELIEATTDATPTPGSNPDFPQAWNDSSGSEVGDLCEGTSATIATPFGSFSVQGIWDEVSHRCISSRTNARDYNVSFAQNAATITAGVTSTFTVQTANTAGTAQPLTLSVTAPAGVTAQLTQTQVTSGQSTTLSITAPTKASALQVVVRADGTTGTAAQSHTAAILLTVN